MAIRDAVIAEARSWIDTPFAHGQRTKGVGVDCGGLVGGICVALGLLPPEWWSTGFAPFDGYAPTPANGALERICAAFMTAIPIETARPGDVVLTRFSVEPQHLAVLVPYVWGGSALVHALSTRGKVVEHRLAGTLAGEITAAYVLPGVPVGRD